MREYYESIKYSIETQTYVLTCFMLLLVYQNTNFYILQLGIRLQNYQTFDSQRFFLSGSNPFSKKFNYRAS